MKYGDLHIETQRQPPNNVRTEGFALLVRPGYLTRESELTALGKHTINRLSELADRLGASFLASLNISTIGNNEETFFPIRSGSIEVIHCPSCNYTERIELARLAKNPLPAEELLPLERVLTPDCSTIESLANFLGVPKEKTAKALMFTRLLDSKFIFVLVRGDMQLSEAKLKRHVGDVHVATGEEIASSGATAGYASPIGLREALIVVDDLIPQSANLVAGANEAGFHLKNTNYGRDYTAEILADLVQANADDACPNCGKSLTVFSAELLATRKENNLENVLLALAEVHHDDRGLALPPFAAPFDVYLMHIAGKEMDTRTKAEELYSTLLGTGISVLFDDRDERAGVKFNDADLTGCPLRVTVGEKNLNEGMVELKARKATEIKLVPFSRITEEIKALLR